MNLEDIKAAATFVFWRLGFGVLISSALILGGTYFIVDNSLRGLEKSIDVTNARIDDLKSSLNEKIDLKFENLETKLRSEFVSTRDAIKKAQLEPAPDEKIRTLAVTQSIDVDATTTIKWVPGILPIDEIAAKNPELTKWYEINKDAIANFEKSDGKIFALAATDSVFSQLSASHDFAKKAFLLSALAAENQLLSHSISNDCFQKTYGANGEVILTASRNTISAANGFLCVLDSVPK